MEQQSEFGVLRFGIIGCGVIGPTHAEAIAANDGAVLVAVADTDNERAQQLARRYQASAHTDIQRMLAEEHLDVVCICTPSGLHGEHAIAAMRAGAHVIVEKPMEITRQAIDEMLRVQRETGRKMAVISQHRFDPASVKVHDLAKDGAFGRLVLGNALVPWWRSQAYYASGAWRGTRALDGGGILMNQSIHSIDLITWLMGPVRGIKAYTDTLAHTMETEDVAVAVVRFANGACGVIAATTGAYPGVTTRIEIFGDGGSAIIENDQLAYLHLRRDDAVEAGAYGGVPRQVAVPAAGGTAADPASVVTTSHALQISDMIEAIRRDRPPLLGGEEARHAVDVILGVYEAAETGREVVL
jgi:UDP-N-acetyl-2-amino-2-deoxyglucuronate dehydrogenase